MKIRVLCAALAIAAVRAAGGDEPCRSAGDPAKGIACYESALAAETEPRARAKLFGEMAWLHMRLAQFERALADFRQVTAIAKDLHDRGLEASAINFTGLLYQTMGDAATARQHYERALPVARETGDRKLEGEVLYHLGWLLFQRGEFREALPYYTESLRARRDSGDPSGEAMTLLGLGMTHTSLGDFDRALQYESEALPIAQRIGNRYAEADALDHMGTALTLLHRPEEAIEKHRRALEIRKSEGETIATTFSYSGIARAQHELGRVRDAATTMGELLDVVEGSRRNVATRRFRASVFSRVRGHYDRYIAYLMELRDFEAAFSASERARARLTLDAVQDALVRADAAAGGTLLQREQTLQNAIERAGANLDDLLAQLRVVEDAIHREYPKLADARDESPMTATQVQSELAAGTAIIEYSLSREHAFAWVLTRDSIMGYEIAKPEDIRDTAVKLHALLSAGDQRTSRREIEALIERLSGMILTPLAIPRVSRLLIVPDGALFYVPFAAMTSRGAALVDKYEITIAPSASAASLMKKAALGRTHDGSVAIFADPVFTADDARLGGKARSGPAVDPDLVRSATDAGLALRRLPATRTEADAISRLAPGRTREALDFAASRKTVLSENLGRYRVVHFATHALVNAQHPELSGIVLSLFDERGAPVQGFVRVHDLYAMDVATDLVVLSACRTAMGKELRGEGMVGLVNGFMHAGSPRVVASFWDVKDEATSELMKRFYQAMFKRGLAPAAALRAAQLSLRSEERWRPPYYWAAFAIFGAR